MTCWCGRRTTDGRCDLAHDPYAIYLCSCGLHLFNTERTAGADAWARHREHMDAFKVRVQARVDTAQPPVVDIADLPKLAAAIEQENNS
jgi:hypothetical protein